MNPFDYSKGYLDALKSLKHFIEEQIESHEYELGEIASNMMPETINETI